MIPGLAGSILGQTTLPTIAPEKGTVWMPPQASSAAAQTDAVFYFIYWISVFFFILITGLLVYFVIRYRRRTAGERAAGTTTQHTALELTWTGIPLLLVAVMFYLGFRGFMDIVNPPPGALNINVVGQKWSWSFTYPNGLTHEELHVPVDTPVKLTLASNDVIHSLFIPAFRLKKDAIPGRYTTLWFKATRPGEYAALCSEFCGTGHSQMVTRVVVHESGMYERWLVEASDPFRTRTLAEVGQSLVLRRCGSCHTATGTAGVGPTFKGLFGHPVKLKDGSTVVADENYVRDSIVYPLKQIVAGYDPVMPTFKGQLKDREITAIIDYLKTLAEQR